MGDAVVDVPINEEGSVVLTDVSVMKVSLEKSVGITFGLVTNGISEL